MPSDSSRPGIHAYAYFEDDLVPFEDARLSIATHAFLYGTACFEGIRAYAIPDGAGLILFRPREHYQRLLASAGILRMSVSADVESLCRLTADLLRRNGCDSDTYIRPMVYKSSRSIGARLDGIGDGLLMFAAPLPPYLDNNKGVGVCISSWRRVGDNAIPPSAKITGGYVNAALAKTEAIENGYDDCIMLTDQGQVSEAASANVFLVKDGTLVTPHKSAAILEGITRDSVLRLARDSGLSTCEREVRRSELYSADEIFLTGTGVQIAPVTSVDRRLVGDGEVGAVTKRIQELYDLATRGQLPGYGEWCLAV